MQICIETKLSLPWDDSSDSFYSGSNSDTIADIDHPHPIEHQLPPPPEDSSINNPYHHPDPAPPRQTLVQTLWSWIVPQPQNSIPPRTVNQTIPKTIKIVEPSQPSVNITSQHYQTVLVTSTDNNHWGHPMITPKPFNTFRVISRNVNTLSTQQDYLQQLCRQFLIAKPTP